MDKQKAENEAAEIAAANNQFNTLKKITNDKRKLFEASRIKYVLPAPSIASKAQRYIAFLEHMKISQNV